MKLIIEDDEGRKTVVPFVREEITIGRQEGNTIRLTERNVSRRHARLIRQSGQVLVEDLGSYTGIRLNGEKIQGQTAIQDGDLLQIGDYDLAIQSETPLQAGNAEPPARRQLEEPETEADAPIVPDHSDGYEDTSPAAKAQDEAVRRQSTSVIHVSQIDTGRSTRQLVDLDPEEAPRLFVLNTPYAGREFACIRTELRLGRTDDNDIAIDHRSLSRTHAKVVREDNGEWRAIDLQSANGLRINGETYAQATLRSGDVLELGHVKFKFLGPGETFRFVPGAYDEANQPRGGRKLVPLVIGALMLAIVAGALMMPGVRAAIGLGPKPQPQPPPEVRVEPAPPAPTPKEAQPPPDSRGTPGGSEAPAVQEADLTQKLAGARAAMDAHEFQKAVDILESAQHADGSRPKQAEELLKLAHAESAAHKAIGQATKELAAGHADAAAEALGPVAGTTAYAKEYEQLKARVDAALKHSPAPAVVKGTDKPEAGEPAKKFFDEGNAFFKKKQYEEAASSFKKCVEADSKFARCYMMLGSIYATLRQPDLGAEYYRKFLALAPNDPKAARVKELLQAYEQPPR